MTKARFWFSERAEGSAQGAYTFFHGKTGTRASFDGFRWRLEDWISMA